MRDRFQDAGLEDGKGPPVQELRCSQKLGEAGGGPSSRASRRGITLPDYFSLPSYISQFLHIVIDFTTRDN